MVLAKPRTAELLRCVMDTPSQQKEKETDSTGQNKIMIMFWQ